MSALSNTFRVALFEGFLEAFMAIPKAQQKKVSQFLRKFREDPMQASINYEKIHDFADPNLRTVRIDLAYRAVVLKPDKGNVYVLLWVDHHDEAIRWARNKRVVVNGETGALQLLAEVTEVMPAASSPTPTAVRDLIKPLFDDRSDTDLLAIGTPPDALPAVRTLRLPEEISQVEKMMPPSVIEGLHYFAAGESLQEVKRAIGLEEKPLVGLNDFAAALASTASRRQFVLVDNDEAMAQILDAPMERWRIFLHPSQRAVVERNWPGPVLVLGGAGTGKTVVAMHRARWLAQKVFAQESDRILFTTFTRNLAHDIRENLSKLLSNAELRRIDVIHLDGWVGDFLRRNGYPYRVDYYREGSGTLQRLWKEALNLSSNDFPEAFYREEWEFVILPQGCSTFEDYKAASRAGRGKPLTRKQRQDVWRVFEEYRNLLESEKLREPEDAMRDAAALLEAGKASTPYTSVLIDEAQDMSTAAFRLLRRIVAEAPNDLFIVGDGDQRIYRRKVVLARAGVKVVGRSRRLRVNYRTTDEIRRYAVGLLEGRSIDDVDGEPVDRKGYRSLLKGVPPTIERCKNFADEIQAIARFVGPDADRIRRTCLVLRTNALLEAYSDALEAKGVPTYRIKRDQAEDHAAPGLRIATMHRVKGLEFDRMVIAGVNDGVVPLTEAMESDDESVREEGEFMERALLYVAATRAKRELLVTCNGTPSPWLSTAHR